MVRMGRIHQRHKVGIPAGTTAVRGRTGSWTRQADRIVDTGLSRASSPPPRRAPSHHQSRSPSAASIPPWVTHPASGTCSDRGRLYPSLDQASRTRSRRHQRRGGGHPASSSQVPEWEPTRPTLCLTPLRFAVTVADSPSAGWPKNGRRPVRGCSSRPASRSQKNRFRRYRLEIAIIERIDWYDAIRFHRDWRNPTC